MKRKEEVPKIKGRKKERKETVSNCYLSREERKAYVKILVNRGIDKEEAKERVRKLADSQREIRKKSKDNKKSEKEIKDQQNKLLEELFNY